MGNIWDSVRGNSYKKVAAQHRHDLQMRIETFFNTHREAMASIPLERKRMIFVRSATELIDLLNRGQMTSVEITYAFIERAGTIGLSLNCVFDQMFQSAIARARQCDRMRKESPKKRSWKYGDNYEQSFPPFFGIPASYKETIKMKGRKTNVGYVFNYEQPPRVQQHFETLTLNMGFIPFIRTTCSQACKTIQTNNNIFGYAKNPWNITRSTGGSSGGEGGLVAAGCSCFGFGTDIGGSLRIPSDWNGLCCLKHSNRYSATGNGYYGKFVGGIPVKGEIGPICRSVQDIILFCQYIFEAINQKLPPQINDPYVIPTSFKGQIFHEKPKLRIGYFKHLPTMQTSRPNQRALEQVLDILKQQGHQLVQIHLPQLQFLYFFMLQLMVCDGNLGLFEQLGKHQPLIDEYKILYRINCIPWLIRKVLMWVLRHRQPRLARLIQATLPLGVKQLFQLLYEAQKRKHDQIYRKFTRNNIDVLLQPGFAFPSPKLGTIKNLQYFFAYTTSWNAIRYPAGSIPVTVVREEQNKYTDQYEDIYTKKVDQNMKEASGLPVGVQVVSVPGGQELILYVMKILERRIEFRKHYCSGYMQLIK